MLSKTAMLLVPAASLVGAAALAPTTSLAYSGENHGFIAVNYPYCQESEGFYGPRRATSKEIEQSRVTNATYRPN